MIGLVMAFGALGDETRLELVRMLADGPKTATDLFTSLAISQPRASRHLRILREAGLIEATRSGRWVHFRIAEDEIARALVALAAGKVPEPGRHKPARPAPHRRQADSMPVRHVAKPAERHREDPHTADHVQSETPPTRPPTSPEIEEFLL